VSNLTLRLTEDIANRHKEYEEMRSDHIELKRMVERLMQNLHFMETGESS
jgi:cell division protein FtsB